MTTSEWKKIARLLKTVYAELEQEAIREGISILSLEYDSLRDKARLEVLKGSGFTLEEYRKTKELIEGISPEGAIVIAEDASKRISKLEKVHTPTTEEITDIADKVAKKYIKPPEIVHKIVKETVVEKPTIVRESKTETVNLPYNDGPVLAEIGYLHSKIDAIKIPEPINIETIKEDIKLDFGAMFKHNIDTLRMPDFRKLAWGLQDQIDALGRREASDVVHPASPSGSIQYNNSGVFGGSSNATLNEYGDITLTSNSGNIPLNINYDASGSFIYGIFVKDIGGNQSNFGVGIIGSDYILGFSQNASGSFIQNYSIPDNLWGSMTFKGTPVTFSPGDEYVGTIDLIVGPSGVYTDNTVLDDGVGQSTFVGITVNDLTASSPVFTDTDKKLVSIEVIPVENGGTGQSSSRRLFTYFTDANNTNTAETDLYTNSIAAGKLTNNGDCIFAEYFGIFSGAVSATQELKIYFGGTVIFDSGALSIGALTPSWDIFITITRVSSSTIRCAVSITTSSAALAATATYTLVAGLTLANAQIMKITGQAGGVAGASSQITAKGGYIDYEPV